MSSMEMYPQGAPEKKLGEAMEQNVSKTPADYEKAALRQHELEASTFGGPAAPGEAPAEIDIGHLSGQEVPSDGNKEQVN